MESLIVIGDGWAALSAVGFWVVQKKKVYWITGSGSHLLFPLSYLKWGKGVEVWKELLNSFHLDPGEIKQGIWTKEYRKKGFYQPDWAEPENQGELGSLGGPEQQFAGEQEAAFEVIPLESERRLREKLELQSEWPLERRVGVPVTHFLVAGLRSRDKPYQVLGGQLATGEPIYAPWILYADHSKGIPSLLKKDQGEAFLEVETGKKESQARRQEVTGVLQAQFFHEWGPSFPSQTGLGGQSFFAHLSRSPEKAARHVWGYYSSDSLSSYWTVCLTEAETDSNAEIARQLKNLKSTLNSMFQKSGLIPESQKSLSDSILKEQVRFAEVGFFKDPRPFKESCESPTVKGLFYLTDGYGPSRAFEQVHYLLKHSGIGNENPGDSKNVS